MVHIFRVRVVKAPPHTFVFGFGFFAARTTPLKIGKGVKVREYYVPKVLSTLTFLPDMPEIIFALSSLVVGFFFPMVSNVPIYLPL